MMNFPTMIFDGYYKSNEEDFCDVNICVAYTTNSIGCLSALLGQ